MRITLFGHKVTISFWFIALITAMLCIDRSGLMLPTLAAVMLHETAHLITMRCLGCAPEEISLVPGAISIKNRRLCTKRAEAAILISGPAANIVLFFLLWSIYKLAGSVSPAIWGAVQLVIGIYNLLPARGFDGGDLLALILSEYIGECTADLVLRIITIIVSVTLITGGVILLFKDRTNLSIVILGVYIFIFFVVRN